MKARAVAGVVDPRAADSVPGVVLAELDRVAAADDPLLGPVQLVRSGLVGDPVAVGVPERALLEHHDLPAAASEALGERPAPGAGADDRQVYGVGVVIARHPLLGNGAPVNIEQERGVVLGRSERAARERPQPMESRGHVRCTPRWWVSATGSRSAAALPSQLSRWPTPRRA